MVNGTRGEPVPSDSRRSQPAPSPTDKQLFVRIRVGEQGTVMKDSVFVTGYAEPSYLRDLRDAMQRNVYWPAVFEGCAVRMVTTINVSP